MSHRHRAREKKENRFIYVFVLLGNIIHLPLLSRLLPSGSHKRSHSLGDKEIGRSPPSPAPEQAFRDRSNTLSEKPALPVIRDKYKDLTGEVEVRKARR